jgi:uncharacterized coiled-coil protein SlyX
MFPSRYDVYVHFDPFPGILDRITRLETAMAGDIDAVTKLGDHVTALEGRDAVRSKAIDDLKTQVTALQATAANADPAVVKALDDLAARLDKVDVDVAAVAPPPANPPAPAPPEPPPGTVTTGP